MNLWEVFQVSHRTTEENKKEGIYQTSEERVVIWLMEYDILFIVLCLFSLHISVWSRSLVGEKWTLMKKRKHA